MESLGAKRTTSCSEVLGEMTVAARPRHSKPTGNDREYEINHIDHHGGQILADNGARLIDLREEGARKTLVPVAKFSAIELPLVA